MGRYPGSGTSSRKAIVKLQALIADGAMEADKDQLTLIKALEQHAFIKTIFQQMPIGIAVSKIDDGATVFVNEHFIEICGWPRESLTCMQTFFQYVYPDEQHRAEMAAKIMSGISSGDPAHMHWQNIHITTQSGESRVVNAKNIPIYAQNLMISTVTDVTTQNKQYKRLTEIALINAHEIRRPIASILGLLQIFNEMMLEKADQEMILHLQSVTQELDDVIKRIIDMAVQE